VRSGSDGLDTSLRVLVVEDTSMIRRIIKQMISMEGHECDAAEHGQVGVLEV
jgi:DNA-binding response OmpR family regulator